MDSLVRFLQDKITDQMPLADIVNVFEQMCSIPLAEDMILFETGTFTTLAAEPVFQISLVRQFSNDVRDKSGLGGINYNERTRRNYPFVV